MIGQDVLKYVSHVFCGDQAGLYSYKTGPKLVEIFNNYFGFKDAYGAGFPSRWAYVCERIEEMQAAGRFDEFLNVALDKRFLMRDQAITEVAAVEHAKAILEELNRVLKQDRYCIVKAADGYHLREEDDDLELIGSGGFADVYRIKSSGLVLKKLKDENLADEGIRSRFKREFELTKSLEGIVGIIKVYDYDENKCEYTMDAAECTLEKYVRENTLNDAAKAKCIHQMLSIMAAVHEKGVVHRDISPCNIFIAAKRLVIADFGLGKNLNTTASHQTISTNAWGSYAYCAPEQFRRLRDANERSDVYSMGRVINFVMTGNPECLSHAYRNVAEKATNNDMTFRYDDAGQMLQSFVTTAKYQWQNNRMAIVTRKIKQQMFDDDVESYITALNASDLCKILLKRDPFFSEALFFFMGKSEKFAQDVAQDVERSFGSVCDDFEDFDPFATFAQRVVQGNFKFVVKEPAARILKRVAWDVNRYYAQGIIKRLLDEGIDPMLEEIIKNS